MSGSATDKFKKATNNFSTTLNGSIGSGDTTIALTSVTNLPTDTGIVLVIDRVDGSGNLTPTLREYVKGVISSNNLISVSRGLGNSTAQAHISGAVVESVPDQVTQNDMVDGILVSHNQDGTMVSSLPLSSPVITSPTIHTFDGWISATETWTYVSADSTNATYTFKISGVDKTGILSAGDRIKLTQTTVKYFIITNVSFSTDTTVTIYGGTDYTLANATITSPYYSHNKSPNGFPVSPLKWTQTTTDTSDRTTTSTTPSNVGSVSLSVPIGAWRLCWQGTLQIGRGSTTFASGNAALSTGTTTDSDADMIVYGDITAATGTLQIDTPFSREKFVAVTTATPYYQNIWSAASSITTGVMGSTGSGETVIKAVCAYL